VNRRSAPVTGAKTAATALPQFRSNGVYVRAHPFRRRCRRGRRRRRRR